MPAAATAREPEEKAACDLCHVVLSTLEPVASNKVRGQVAGNTHIQHWILPESYHTKGVKDGLWTRVESNEAFISACYMCHQAAINSFSETERALFVNTPSKLKNALIEIGWRQARNAGRLNPSHLKDYKWATQELSDYKMKNCSFNGAINWSQKGDLNSLVNRGEAHDMYMGATKEAKVQVERLETRLKTKHNADIDGLKEHIQVTNGRLERLKERFNEVQQKVNEEKEEDENAVEAKALAVSNKELIDILRRGFDEVKEDSETDKEIREKKDQARDDQIQFLFAGLEALKANQSQNKGVRKRVDKLEWKFTEAGARVGKDKGKRKRQESARPAQYPPTANEVMDDPETVLAKKNRKIRTQVSHSDSETSDATDEEPDVRQLSKVQPPAKRQRKNDGVEVSIPRRPVAKRTGQSGSSASARPTPTREVATNNATANATMNTANANAQPPSAEKGPAETTLTEQERQAALAKKVQHREETAEALRQAAVRQAVNNIVRSTTIRGKVPAVDMSPSRQAATASSSGTSNGRPASHPSPRASAPGLTSKQETKAPKKEQSNSLHANAFVEGSNIANASARSVSNDIRSIFPSLSSREESVMSELPDLPFQGKKANPPVTPNTANGTDDEPVFVSQKATARSKRQERRKSQNISVKREKKDE